MAMDNNNNPNLESDNLWPYVWGHVVLEGDFWMWL